MKCTAQLFYCLRVETAGEGKEGRREEGGGGGGNLIRLPLSILLCSLRPAEEEKRGEEERRESLSISHEFGELVAVQVCVPLAAGGRESKKTLFIKKKEVGERD